MKSSVAFAGLVLSAIAVWVSIPQRTAAIGSDEASHESTLSTEQLYNVPTGPWRGRTEAFGEPGLEKAAGKTIPTFTRTIIAHGRSFHYTMVGTDPFVRQAKKIVIPV